MFPTLSTGIVQKDIKLICDCSSLVVLPPISWLNTIKVCSCIKYLQTKLSLDFLHYFYQNKNRVLRLNYTLIPRTVLFKTDLKYSVSVLWNSLPSHLQKRNPLYFCLDWLRQILYQGHLQKPLPLLTMNHYSKSFHYV